MKNRFYIALVVLGLLSYNTTKAQLQIEFSADAGVSNFANINKEKGFKFGNTYESLFSYGFGVSASYPIISDWWRIGGGIKYAQLGANNNMPKDMSFPNGTLLSWDEKFHTLQIPIKIDYAFEKWLHFNIGVSNKFNLNTPDHTQSKKIEKYALAFVGGFDFILYDKFTLGASYYRDMTAVMLPYKNHLVNKDTYKMRYYVEQYTINVGYILDFDKKKKE